ncbi:MAG: hypothetical protein EXR49_09310 [Dehalococcoidia bacterium]|nr:hypothetical protein [Dehalococcoidia bacterium]
MEWPHGCKRCGGDLVLHWDVRWTYVVCLACDAVQVDEEKLAMIALEGFSRREPREMRRHEDTQERRAA